MKLHVPLPKSECLTNETLDILMLANQHLGAESKRIALEHIGECSKCRTRCIDRSTSLNTKWMEGVLKPDGLRSIPAKTLHLSPASLSDIGACMAAVGILGVAFLSPLFLQRSAQIVTPQVRQHGENKAVKTPSKSEIKEQMLAYMATQIKGLEKKINQIDAELKGKNIRWKMPSGDSVQLLGNGVVRSNGSKTGVHYYTKNATSSRRRVISSASYEALLQQRMMLQKKLAQTKALALRLQSTPPEKFVHK